MNVPVLLIVRLKSILLKGSRFFLAVYQPIGMYFFHIFAIKLNQFLNEHFAGLENIP